ncbi:hypothetical protein SNE40_021548 [Patella caerulea]|uniref:Uncharacterized protein n=1 Tax=Patella caerulea TaxID=87958 RepID=A0AAN8GIY8_PATCE
MNSLSLLLLVGVVAVVMTMTNAQTDECLEGDACSDSSVTSTVNGQLFCCPNDQSVSASSSNINGVVTTSCTCGLRNSFRNPFFQRFPNFPRFPRFHRN